MKVFNKGNRSFEVKNEGELKRVPPHKFTDLEDSVGELLIKNYPREISKTDDTPSTANNKKLAAENAKLKAELEQLKAKETKKEVKKETKKEGK